MCRTSTRTSTFPKRSSRSSRSAVGGAPGARRGDANAGPGGGSRFQCDWVRSDRTGGRARPSPSTWRAASAVAGRPVGTFRQAREAFEGKVRQQQRSQTFSRREIKDPRYGGVITNAATLSMTSGPTRTHPIARGAWIIEVIFNDPPPPPPNDVPPLNENDGPQNLTIRERFAKHRQARQARKAKAELSVMTRPLDCQRL